MNFADIVKDSFITEAQRLKNHNSLLLLDIDDTLLTASSIYIYKKTKDGEIKLKPAQFAEESKKPDYDESKYDFRDFRDKTKVAASIEGGKPIISNLKMMDSYIKNGWKIGLLTARAMEDVMAKTMQMWLMYRTAKGDLKPIGDLLPRNMVFAVSDKSRGYEGATVDERKKNVIAKLSKKYDRIMFIDDDEANIKKVKASVESERAKKSSELQKVYTKLAKEDK